jgi:predicted  nucleic acid-binding Zn-ribbon protein
MEPGCAVSYVTNRRYRSRVAKLDCPECGGNLFLMAKEKDKSSWRCCTRPTHVFEMDGDRTLVLVPVPARPETEDHRAKVAEEIGRGCCDDADLLKRLGDL